MSEHVSLADLVERLDTPPVREHLDRCPSCRARSRLLSGLDTELEDDELDVVRASMSQALKRASESLVATLTGGGSAAEGDELEPGRSIDRYEVVERIASGGMGTVYRVRHTQLDSEHALKVIRRRWTSKTERERLLREGKAQGSLRHPNLLPVTDVVDVDGAPGLIMDLVRGPTLADHLRECAPLEAAEVDALAEGILRGVSAAHRAGLIHRDLKPGNVLLARTDGQFVPKVADFGLARPSDPDEDPGDSVTHGPLGTPAYMAPEQIRDASSADVRSDVFSLGALLYELVTGKRAHGGLVVVEVYDDIRAGRWTPVRERAPEAPERWVRAIERAMALDPADRFASCDALLEAWRGERETVPARPVPPAPSAILWRWTPIAAAAALGLMFVAGRLSPREAPVVVEPAVAAVEAPRSPSKDRRVTARPSDRQVFAMAVSPDGTEVAWGDGTSLTVQPVHGGQPRVVLDQGPYHDVGWFPDGEHLMVRSTGEATPGVWRVRKDGSGAEKLLQLDAYFIRLSPDGTRLAAVNQSGVWIHDLEAGTRRRLRPLTGADGTTALAWSPTGEHVAAVHWSGADQVWLEITSVDGRSSRRVVNDRRLVALALSSVVWLAGDRLVYGLTDKRENVTRLMALDGASEAVDDEAALELRRFEELQLTHIDASEDGETLVYTRIQGRQVPLLVDLTGEQEARKLAQDDWDQVPVGWRDPSTVLLQKMQGGGQVVAQPLAGGEPEVIQSDIWMGWRADRVGRDLLFLGGVKEKRGGVFRVRDGERTLIVDLEPGEGTSQSHVYRMRCRKSRCLLGGLADGVLSFEWVDPESGARTPAPIEPFEDVKMVAWDLAPDGRRLAWTGRDQAVVVQDLETGAKETWPLPLAGPMELTWSPVEDAVYVSGLTHSEIAYAVYEVRPESSRIVHSSLAWYLYRPTPSPDGRWLALANAAFDDDLWVAELRP